MKPFDERDYSKERWEDKSWVEIERCAGEGYIVLLPLGSIEQHGPMLPVGCDRFLAESWALEAARKARENHGVSVLVCPTVTYGVSTEHIDFSGTLSLELATYINLIQDIVREVVRAGFKKIACVSGHGGNVLPAHELLRDLKSRFKKKGRTDVRLYMADKETCFMDCDSVYDQMHQDQFAFHADAGETSYYLFQRPDLIKKEGLTKPTVHGDGLPIHGWWTKEITETGASGDPTKATIEHGQRLYAYFTDALALFLLKIKEDD